MPLPMVHLGVAHLLTETLAVRDPGSFYLGSIAPDAVHMRAGTYQSEWKLKSHLRESRQIEKHAVIGHALAFLRNHADSPERDFFAGYGVHIITDILWNQTLLADFNRAFQEDGGLPEERSGVYYNATDRLDFELFHRMPWRPAVWDALAGSHGADADGLVSAAETDAWKERTLHWYDSGESQHKAPVRYFTYDGITLFIAYAAEETGRLLGN